MFAHKIRKNPIILHFFSRFWLHAFPKNLAIVSFIKSFQGRFFLIVATMREKHKTDANNTGHHFLSKIDAKTGTMRL